MNKFSRNCSHMNRWTKKYPRWAGEAGRVRLGGGEFPRKRESTGVVLVRSYLAGVDGDAAGAAAGAGVAAPRPASNAEIVDPTMPMFDA